MEIRTLRRSERELLLDLLDCWEVPDGWAGRDLFRRYIEDDPTFADENVWVAVDDGRLVSCVQIFPRPLQVRGRAVPTGGIGSVFTLPDYRRGGVAGLLLERAAEVMFASGCELSLLFAARIAWYTRLGWRSWPVTRTLLARRDPSPPAAAAEILHFDAARDLAEVEDLYRDYSGALDGTVVRDELLWQASLANAGNPGEDFRVVRRGEEVLAYARVAILEGFPTVIEFGRRAECVAALADLMSAMIDEHAATCSLHLDPELERALESRGFDLHRGKHPFVMLRCIDAAALARRLDLEPPVDGDPSGFLESVLPADRFAFWTADRF